MIDAAPTSSNVIGIIGPQDAGLLPGIEVISESSPWRRSSSWQILRHGAAAHSKTP